MESSVAIVPVQASTFEQLLCRAKERGLSLAEGRTLESFLARGETWAAARQHANRSAMMSMGPAMRPSGD